MNLTIGSAGFRSSKLIVRNPDGREDCRTSICHGPLRRKYDKRAGRIMIRDLRNHYFGKRKRLTKARCEKFFSNEPKFHLDLENRRCCRQELQATLRL